MIVFCTNMWNHHLGPVCIEMQKHLKDDFRMILSLPLADAGLKACAASGISVLPPSEPWIVGPPGKVADLKCGCYRDLILNADVAIIGAMPAAAHGVIAKRVRHDKTTFFMHERLFKEPRRWGDYVNPRRLWQWAAFYAQYSRPNVHCLTMNHWCPDDLAFFHVCKGRTWRWGYLPPVSETPIEKPVHEKVRIGWCGRLLCWKNVSDILQAGSLLENTLRRKIEIAIVGDGPEKQNLICRAHELGLNGVVQFKPFMSAADAKEFMRGLDIYVFPSGRMEGWGAALSEAMDASCAVIANADAGATLELIKDGENGFVYANGDIQMLSQCMSRLIGDASLRKRFGLAAWQTMQKWSPAVGGRRLVELAEQVLHHESPRFTDGGLCSLRR